MFPVHRRRPLLDALVACVVALALIVVAPAAAVGKRPAPPAQLDVVTVTGSDDQLSGIDIRAQSEPGGANPSGTGTFVVFGLIHVEGPVTCLSVTGTTAILNIVDQTSGSGVVAVSLTDNGGSGRDVMTVLGGVGSTRAPTDCSPFVGLVNTLTNGRASVFDAPPPPTAKDQCKNGGWARYGFVNQGQCIKFVDQP